MDDASSQSMAYIVHAKLPREYAMPGGRKCWSNDEMERMRAHGRKCLSLWCDGSLYPIDKRTSKKPPFNNISSLLQYTGEGHNGLLGYIKQLDNESSFFAGHASILANQLRDISRSMKTLQDEVKEKQIVIEKLTTSLQESESIRAKQETIAMERLAASQQEMQAIRMKHEKMQQKIDALKKTPFGMRSRRKDCLPIEKLSLRSGNFKKRVRAIRMIASATTTSSERGKGNLPPQVLRTSELVDGIVTKRRSVLTRLMANLALKEVAEAIKQQDIVYACDKAGISRKAYEAIYNIVREALHSKKFYKFILPQPKEVQNQRKERTNLVREDLGQFSFITAERIFKNSKGESRKFQLSKENNIFIDLLRVQERMVRHYNINVQEHPTLQFCLKMDESEIKKGQKLERVSIVLMNGGVMSVTRSMKRENPTAFSIQSEEDTWWLSAFQVPKENHDVLSWVFSLSDLPQIISRQVNGEKLLVDGIGEFSIDWHMSGDLKTIKCLGRCEQGSRAKYCCPFCKVQRKVQKNTNEIKWLKDCISVDYTKPPDRDQRSLNVAEEDCVWDPIFNIPLTNTHFCTLHAEMRILDKLLHLHINYANTMPNSKSVMRDIECMLNEMGAYGGNTKIGKDVQLSGKTQDVPTKVSIGGAKSRRFLSPMAEKSYGKYEYWRRLCEITTSKTKNASHALMYKEVWVAFNKLAVYLRRHTIDLEEAEEYQVIVTAFSKAFIKAWGERHFTFYMHILQAHGYWFIKTYGSLSRWSAQGMEKSHWRARGAFFKSTRHGGGKGGSIALDDLFIWFYRTAHGRKEAQNKLAICAMSRAIKKANYPQNFQRWASSGAQAGFNRWIGSKLRQGRKWI